MNRDGYGNRRRVNIPAMGLSLLLVGGMMMTFVAMGIISVDKKAEVITVVEMLPDTAPPPPPPEAKPVQTVTVPSPVVAPPPLVSMPVPPSAIITSPVPSPPVNAPVSLAPVPGPPAPPQAAAPAVASMGDMSSGMMDATPPSYPTESRRKHEEGVVVLAVLLGTDGRVMNINISRSSGFDRLDRAALSAVRRWRWSPIRKGGQAVMVRGFVEIPFVLQDDGRRNRHHKRHNREENLETPAFIA